MENKKLTKRDYFNELKGIVADNAELVAFIDHELELLDKKASKSSQTKTQKENEGIKDLILEGLRELNRPSTITDLQGVETLKEFSNQKLSALVKQLVESGSVVKSTDKKKSYFAIAE